MVYLGVGVLNLKYKMLKIVCKVVNKCNSKQTKQKTKKIILFVRKCKER